MAIQKQERWTLTDIMALFDGIFTERYQTRLIKGGDEPLYLPADSVTPYHQVIFARGYFASALHEVSHWCIAGAQRRQQEDYGYWYLPDGRNEQQQRSFEIAEIAPQALELLFTEACGRSFCVSVDNLAENIEVNSEGFAEKVTERARRYQREGLPLRANAFQLALAHYYKAERYRVLDSRHQDSRHQGSQAQNALVEAIQLGQEALDNSY